MDATRRVNGLVEAAAGLAPLIRAHADENERERRLAPAVVDAFHEAGLFRALVPERFGGAGLDIAQAVPLFEEVASADGSAGWNLAIGATSASFVLMLDDEGAIEEILKTPRTLLAGSVNPMALRILPEDGGYRIRGRLQYASGAERGPSARHLARERPGRHRQPRRGGGWRVRAGRPELRRPRCHAEALRVVGDAAPSLAPRRLAPSRACAPGPP